MFNDAFIELLKIAPTPNSVNSLRSEKEEFEFIKAFRVLMRLKNILLTFSDYDASDLSMSDQSFADYSSKYLDLRDKVNSDRTKEKASILGDIDFELELIHRDEINVAYILELIVKMKNSNPEKHEAQRKAIMGMLASEVVLRSKRELIEKFIESNLPNIEDSDDVAEAFDLYVKQEKAFDFNELVRDEDIDSDKLNKVISDYVYTKRDPLRDDLINTLHVRPALRERKIVYNRVFSKLESFVAKYI